MTYRIVLMYKLSPLDVQCTAISLSFKQQQQIELESLRYAASSSSAASFSEEQEPKRKKYKKDAYFSDEEEFEDGWSEEL